MRLRRLMLFGFAAMVVAPLALAWAGRPTSPAPKPATRTGPPPAWAEAPSKSTWLAYSGYCWKTVCADYLPPASRPDLPTIAIARGTIVRLHFAFRPSKITLTSLGATTSQKNLTPAQVVTWKPSAAAVFTLSLKGALGTVAYPAKIGFRQTIENGRSF